MKKEFEGRFFKKARKLWRIMSMAAFVATAGIVVLVCVKDRYKNRMRDRMRTTVEGSVAEYMRVNNVDLGRQGSSM